MRRPRIAVTQGADRIAEYIRAIESAGGEAHPLETDRERVLEEVRAMDGLVVSGGADVDPSHYGEPPHPQTVPASPERDAYELALVRAAFHRSVPALLICRGLQVANVAFGGTLHQHVPDVYGERVRHSIRTGDERERGLIDDHVVSVVPGSELSAVVGSTLVTGSRHHQAVDRVAARLCVVARARDGVVEALEPLDATRFWLAVQWHPESTIDADDGASIALFRALVAAATP